MLVLSFNLERYGDFRVVSDIDGTIETNDVKNELFGIRKEDDWLPVADFVCRLVQIVFFLLLVLNVIWVRKTDRRPKCVTAS